jgi:hypothetical protein
MMKPKRGSKAKEVPQWKLDMMAAESAGSSQPTAAPAAAAAAEGASDTGAPVSEAAQYLNQYLKRRREDDDSPKRPREEDDDDDDDDVDLSKYQFGDDDDEEEVVNTGTKGPQLTREQQLLMREAQYGGPKKSTRTFTVEDSLNSEEQSLGRERSQQRKQVMANASSTGLPTKLPASFGGRGR